MKKLLLSISLLLLLVPFRYSTCKAQETTPAPALANGLALTPPLGWNSWNSFQCSITEQIVRQMADAMVSSGMAAAGYKYINIDDCWQNVNRTNGHVTTSSNFSSGIKSMADYVHSKGLKLGVYSCRGTKTCGGRAGSYGYEVVDAKDYAAWGVDYLKYDNCFEATGSNQQKDFENMRDALKNCGRDIVFSICAWEFHPWEPNTGNLWRTKFDIYDQWPSMLDAYDINVVLAQYAKPGAWNDPDMPHIGGGGMTDLEYRTNMSLWSIMAAPILVGTDLRNMSAVTKATLTNPEIIAVDQDPLGKQGVKVRDDGEYEVISKEMKGVNIRSVALLNRSGAASNIKVSWSEIGLPAGSYTVRDLWAKQDVGVFNGSYTVNVPSHGTAMLRIIPTTNCTGSTADAKWEFIERVQFGYIDNTSIATTYTDFTAKSTSALRGSTMNLTVTIGTYYPADKILVWCDWNNDKIFDSNTELALTMDSITSGPNPYKGSITIPANAFLGKIKMRIKMIDTANDPNYDPCGTTGTGEVEDYSIICTDNVTSINLVEGAAMSVDVYSGLTQGTFSLKCNFPTLGNYSLEIVNMLGQVVYQESLNVNANLYTKEIDLSKEGRGIYLVKVKNNNQAVTKKVVLQ